jgi:succinate dehydrogenase/fumarate reductase cytochrome b subunit
MFSGNILTVTVLSSLFGIYLVEYLERKISYHQIFKIILLILLLFSIYNFFGGLRMIFDWEDPLANATPEQRGRASARRRGGLVLLIIEYWPYVLTIFGALWSFIYYSAFKKRI